MRYLLALSVAASAVVSFLACGDYGEAVVVADAGTFQDAGVSLAPEAASNPPEAGATHVEGGVDVPSPKRCEQAQRPGAEAPRCFAFDGNSPLFGFDRVEASNGTVGPGVSFASGPSLSTQVSYAEAPSGEAFGAFTIRPVAGPRGLRFTVEADVVIARAAAGRSLLLAVAFADCGQILGAAVEAQFGETDRLFIRSGLAAEPRVEIFPDVPFHLTLAVDNARANAVAIETVFVNGTPLPPQQLQVASRCGDLEVRVGIHQSNAPSGAAAVRFDNVVYWNE